MIDGVTAGNISIVHAAVLDRYPRADWGRYFAYLSTATGLGFVLGVTVTALVIVGVVYRRQARQDRTASVVVAEDDGGLPGLTVGDERA